MTLTLSRHDRELNERFVVLRSHYLFDSVFCNVAAAWEKGTVENLVGYARRNCLTPVPLVGSIGELNPLLLEWCEKERQKHNDEWDLELKGLRELPRETLKTSSSLAAIASTDATTQALSWSIIYQRWNGSHMQ